MFFKVPVEAIKNPVELTTKEQFLLFNLLLETRKIRQALDQQNMLTTVLYKELRNGRRSFQGHPDNPKKCNTIPTAHNGDSPSAVVHGG